MAKHRGWCFTVNNPTDEDEALLQEDDDRVKYIVVGHEVGEEGTPHLQGFILFHNAVRFATVKESVGERAHLEAAKGNSFQAMTYCKKDGDFWEHGDVPKDPKAQGAEEKERWKRAREAACKGEFDDIPDDIFIRYYGNLKKIHQEKQVIPKALDVLDNWWFWGPTGTGKSRTARAENPVYYEKMKNKWWDGYVDQPCVIIEEWCPDDEQFLAQFLKRWADHYPFASEVKGGTKMLRPPKLIVCSNWRLCECFKDANNLNPLLRRFQQREFLGDWNATSPNFVAQ